MGIGDWGLGIGDWGLGPIPNPQSPNPNPQSPIIYFYFFNKIFIISILLFKITKFIIFFIIYFINLFLEDLYFTFYILEQY